jgi:16S rRNA (guanine527-N7)-methyltransferase
LIGWTEPLWIVENLFLDSLLFLKVLPGTVRSLMDLGSGAGIPGIPIKIVQPSIRLTLLEARQRRASFLSTAIRELALPETRVVNERAEQASGDLAGSFDAVVVRCVGTPDRLVPLALGFLRPGGLLVSSAAPDESSRRPDDVVVVPGFRAGTTRTFVVRQR